jgi:hypothetical protein
MSCNQVEIVYNHRNSELNPMLFCVCLQKETRTVTILSNKDRKHTAEYKAERALKMQQIKEKRKERKREAKLRTHEAQMELIRSAADDEGKQKSKARALLMKRLTKNGLNPAQQPTPVAPKTNSLAQLFKGAIINAAATVSAVAAAAPPPPAAAAAPPAVKTLLLAKGAVPSDVPTSWHIKVERVLQRSQVLFRRPACLTPSVVAE